MLRQRQPMMRNHRLVGGDETLTRIERGARQRQRRPVGSADQFEHHIDIGSLGHRLHVIDPRIGAEIDAAVARPVARIDRDDFDCPSGASLDHRAVSFEQGDYAGADSAETGKRDT